MKATAHFKAVVLLSVCLAGAAAIILTHDHAGAPAAGTPGNAVGDDTIQTVTVVGKRMTSEEKASYDRDRQNNRFATRKAAGRDNG